MSTLIKPKYIKYFYLSDFSISFALGMIPLMTVLSYLISSLATSTFGYALMLALYNIATALPKMYVAKNLSNKKNTFNFILMFKILQIFVWLFISIVFFTFPNTNSKVWLFCSLYLIYAFTKGSTDILNIDVYSRVIPSEMLGKFFGYKHSFNSLGEFIGAMALVSLLNFLKIEMNYGIIFMLVFMLDLLSFIMLCAVKPVVKLHDVESSNEKSIVSNLNADTNSLKKAFNGIKNTCREIYDVIHEDSNFKAFLIANIVSIIGASVASFFIPYGTDKLNLSMSTISVANALWLISKVVSAIAWGYVVDFVGAKYTMIGSRLALLLSYIIAIRLDSVFMFCMMLILHGISSSALVIMAQNIFIEIGKDKGPLYAAINSIICLPFFVLMPLVSSLLSEKVGYHSSFIISSIPLAISLLLMLRIKKKKVLV